MAIDLLLRDEYRKALSRLTTFAKGLRCLRVIKIPGELVGENRRFVAYLPPEKISLYDELYKEMIEKFNASDYERQPVVHVWPRNVGNCEQINISFTEAKGVETISRKKPGDEDSEDGGWMLLVCADKKNILHVQSQLLSAGIECRTTRDHEAFVSKDDLLDFAGADSMKYHYLTGWRYTARLVYENRTERASAGILLSTNPDCRLAASQPRRQRPGKGQMPGITEIILPELPEGLTYSGRFFIEDKP